MGRFSALCIAIILAASAAAEAPASPPDLAADPRGLLGVEAERRYEVTDYRDEAGPLLLTAIGGRPRGWSNRALLGAFARMPLLTLGVIARIHWQALRLWWKGVPFLGARPAKPALQEPSR